MRTAKIKDIPLADPTPPGLPIGEVLRLAREERGLTMDMVSNELMIRRFYLEALENGALHDLPERVYATGFVKNYAQYLGLDTFALVEQFKKEAYGTRSSGGYQVELNMPEPVTHSVVPGRSALIGALFALILLGAGIVFFTQNGRKSTTSAIPPPAMGDEKPAPMAAGNTQAEPEAATGFASAEATPEFTGSQTETAAPIPAALPAAAAKPAPATNVQNRRVLEALQSSWVEVRDNKGTILFTSILKAGQLLPLPDNMRVTLTMGNSGGIRMILDGVPQPAFGQVNEVKRNIAIEAPAAPAPAAARR